MSSVVNRPWTWSHGHVIVSKLAQHEYAMSELWNVPRGRACFFMRRNTGIFSCNL